MTTTRRRLDSLINIYCEFRTISAACAHHHHHDRIIIKTAHHCLVAGIVVLASSVRAAREYCVPLQHVPPLDYVNLYYIFVIISDD